MVGEVLASLGAFKAMLDLAKGLKDINDATTRNAVAIELQEKILAAQAEQAALVEAVRELKAQVVGFETWETEKQRYELKALPPGVHVYTLKPDMAASEPAHHICQTCYQRNKKSILDQGETRSDVYHLTCNECGADLKVGQFRPPRVNRSGGSNSWTRR